MKDEEMAEKYLKEKLEERKDKFVFELPEVYITDVKQAFLAGLKAGRLQWHDLRKDPNDLPKDKEHVWCDYGDGYGKGFYDKDDGGWWIEGHMYCSIIDAWCEIPTFDKE